jgi:LAO/AO transport system kinase
MNSRLDPEALLSGDRRTLSRALSLAESAGSAASPAGLVALLGQVAGRGSSLRVGVAGPPGVGKSSLIDELGAAWCAEGLKVAVLAVDPRSPRTGGAVLGDKLRMAKLAEQPGAYVRPMACRTAFGGVFPGWHEAILLCEAAGFDIVVTETIGVGQGEVVSSHLSDAYVVVLAPGLGDEIQGLKRGSLELADVIVVTKADGGTEELARATAREYKQAMSLYGGRVAGRGAQVTTASSRTGTGIADLAGLIVRVAARPGEVERETARRHGLRAWTRHLLVEEFAALVARDGGIGERLDEVLPECEAGRVTATAAATEILGRMLKEGTADANGVSPNGATGAPLT